MNARMWCDAKQKALFMRMQIYKLFLRLGAVVCARYIIRRKLLVRIFYSYLLHGRAFYSDNSKERDKKGRESQLCCTICHCIQKAIVCSCKSPLGDISFLCGNKEKKKSERRPYNTFRETDMKNKIYVTTTTWTWERKRVEKIAKICLMTSLQRNCSRYFMASMF